jgi:hypothetical protein
MELREFKDDIKTVAEYLARAGHEVPHTLVLEAFSRGFGERNWSTMREALAHGGMARDRRATSAPVDVSPQTETFSDHSTIMSKDRALAELALSFKDIVNATDNGEPYTSDELAGPAFRHAHLALSLYDPEMPIGVRGSRTTAVVEKSTPIPEQGLEASRQYRKVEGHFVGIRNDGTEVETRAWCTLSEGAVIDIELLQDSVGESLPRFMAECFEVPGLTLPLRLKLKQVDGQRYLYSLEALRYLWTHVTACEQAVTVAQDLEALDGRIAVLQELAANTERALSSGDERAIVLADADYGVDEIHELEDLLALRRLLSSGGTSARNGDVADSKA